MLDTGAMLLFVSHKLAKKLPATIQMMKSLTTMLPMGMTLVAIMAIDLNMLINDYIYM